MILAVVLVNARLGFVQEGKAEAALEGIRRMLSLEAMVVREGHRRQVPAEQLVPGDLVLLESGDRVPADLRLLSASPEGRFEIEGRAVSPGDPPCRSSGST